jgi:hypothetical protein
MHAQLETVTDSRLLDSSKIVSTAINRMMSILGKMQQNGQDYVQAHARRFVDLASYVAQATLLLAEAQWELDNDLPTFKVDVVDYFVNKHLNTTYDPLDDEQYTERLERLMTAL